MFLGTYVSNYFIISSLYRFNDDNGRNFNPMAYQGFGNGPRSCVGMRYAQQLLKLTFANILAKYKIIPDERYFEVCAMMSDIRILVN